LSSTGASAGLKYAHVQALKCDAYQRARFSGVPMDTRRSCLEALASYRARFGLSAGRTESLDPNSSVGKT
jgi:hypothetical protein